jgi:hypothetical protein
MLNLSMEITLKIVDIVQDDLDFSFGIDTELQKRINTLEEEKSNKKTASDGTVASGDGTAGTVIDEEPLPP